MVEKTKIKSLIIDAFVRMMGGIIRLALRNGVSCSELVDICKLLYVKISAEEYGIRGRETNDSRIALMTGIDRKEVKSIKDRIKNIGQYDGEPYSMSSILTHWHSSELYCADDTPLELPLDGPAPSFTRLVKECSPSAAPITVLKEFQRSKVVVETENGLLKAVKRVYIPNYFGHNSDKSPELVNPKAIGLGSSMLTDHINTIFHNLYREDINQPEQFDLRATNRSVSLSKAPEFYKMIDREGMELLVKVDNWLSENETDKDSNEPSVRLGLGVYSIEGEDSSVKIGK